MIQMQFFYFDWEMDNLPIFCIYLPDLDATLGLSALEEICDEEAVSITVPSALPPHSTSLRVFVDQSETLTKLVQLGN